MRRLSLLLIFLLVLICSPDSLQAGREKRLELKIYGGIGYHLMGDISDGLKGMNEGAEASPYGHISNGEFGSFHFGLDIGGEFIINIAPRLGIGLGVGYIQTGKESRREVEYGEHTEPIVNSMQQLKPKVRAIPITLNFHLGLCSSERINWITNVGVGYYFGRFDWQYHEDSLSFGPYNQSWTGKSNTLGFHAGIELEFQISGSAAFFVEALGRYARLGNLEGDLAANGTTTKNAFLWYSEWGQFPLLEISDAEPTSGISQNVHKAAADLSGVSVRVGIKLGL
jgi:hypothetical protein